MKATLKQTLALILALVLCVTVFAACKGEEGDDTSSLTSFSPTVSIPSEAEINLDTGELTMAYGSTYADLKTDLIEQGKFLEEDGEVLQLFQADKITEITDESTVLKNGMIVTKKDSTGQVIFELTLVITAEIVSQIINSDGIVTITQQDGTQITYQINSDGTQSIVSIGSTSNDPDSTTTSTSDSFVSSSVPSVDIDNIPSLEISSMDSELTTDQISLTIAGLATDQHLALAILTYQKTHPNVKIRVVAPPDVSYSGRYTSLTGLKMQLASGQAPDIVNMDQNMVCTGGYQGYLLELSQFGSNDVEDLFIESCIDACRGPDGNLYALPFDANVMNLFYNKDLLDAAGAPVPTTYDELIQACNLLKGYSDAIIPYGMTGNAFMYYTYLWRFGGDIFNNDFTASAFAEDEGVRALQTMVDLAHRYHASAADIYEDNIFGLMGGTTAMCITNSIWRENFFGANVATNYGITTLPVLVESIPAYSIMGLYSLALPNKISYLTNEAQKEAAIKKAQVAYDFIEFYTSSKDYQLIHCEKDNLIPSVKSAREDAYFQSPFFEVVFAQLEISKARPGVRNFDTIETYLNEAVSSALNGSKSPQEALKAAAVLVNRQL